MDQSIGASAPRGGALRALISALRIHQWSKNALVLVPVVLAPGIPHLDLLLRAVLAALCMSLCASAGYVLNDLLDLEADRAHPTKRQRPFASGALPVQFGPALLAMLLAASFALASWQLSTRFCLMLALYLVATVSYSLYFKRRLLLDVLVLAGLYTHRILAGGVATHVPVSAWLLAFSMFLFLSLSFAKRYVEIAQQTADGKIKNRDYYRADAQVVGSLGAASGYLSALVFSLYLENVGHLDVYREPRLLWAAVPILIYWVSRIWILAGRGQMNDDPVKFALRDSVSIACGLAIAAAAALARFTPVWLLSLLDG
ncbi:MAG TPA: UbiA family prenyltransferase [Polyangiaceae bacterium]|nr:UbiA family prenyltransferase [Polyangiaceae bacterium]